MANRMMTAVLAAATLAFVLTSCTATPPMSPQAIPDPMQLSRSADSKTVLVSFYLDEVPATSPASRKVRSLRISFSGNPTPAKITLSGSTCSSCQATLSIPGATRLVYVDALDSTDKTLSRTWLNVGPVYSIVASPYINLTLASTVGNISISTETQALYGKPAVIRLFVAGLSDLNRYIVGPGQYTPSITVRPDARFSAMGFSATTLRNSAAPIASLRYNGGFQSAAIVARANGLTRTAMVAPLLSSRAVAIPESVHTLGLAASGNDVWVNGRSIFAHVDAASGAVKDVKLGTLDAYPGAVTTAPNGRLWYGGCWPSFHGNDRTIDGIGSITPLGATGFIRIPAKRVPICAPLSVGPDGSVWFVDQTDLQGPITRMTPDGVFSRLSPAAYASELSNVAFASDGTLWVVGYNRVGFSKGELFHYSASGALLGKYGKGFSQVVSSGDSIFAYTETDIRRFSLSGALLATYTPVLPLPINGSLAAAVTSDGAMWFSKMDPNGTSGVIVFERIDTNGSFSELIAEDGGGMAGLAASKGSLWYAGHEPEIRRIDFEPQTGAVTRANGSSM
jgi:streptogramin lyase